VNTSQTTGRDSHIHRARRLGWGIADQALSSVTNFALAILVARNVSTADLGAFGLTFTTYTFVLGATRAICSEPMSVRYSARDSVAWERGARRTTGAALILGAAAGVVTAIVSFAFSGSLKGALLALAVCLPGLIVQDTWRTAFFSNVNGRSAFMNDLIWAVAQTVFIVIALVTHHRTTPAFMLAWGLAASVAAVAGSVQSGVIPKPSSTGRWFHRQRDLAPRYLAEFFARNAANAGCMYLTAVFGGLSAAGALRGAQIVLGPLNILNMGLTAPAVTEAVRISRRSASRMLKMVALLGAALVVISLTWGIVMYLLPEQIGQALLKRSWTSAHSVILPFALVMAASGSLTGATVGLRALAAARRSLNARLVTGAISLATTAVGAYTGQAAGAALGLALGLWLGSVLWWVNLRAQVEETERRRSRRQEPRTMITPVSGAISAEGTGPPVAGA
jgi:O-antigen/teichoic acid export membrane protein